MKKPKHKQVDSNKTLQIQNTLENQRHTNPENKCRSGQHYRDSPGFWTAIVSEAAPRFSSWKRFGPLWRSSSRRSQLLASHRRCSPETTTWNNFTKCSVSLNPTTVKDSGSQTWFVTSWAVREHIRHQWPHEKRKYWEEFEQMEWIYCVTVGGGFYCSQTVDTRQLWFCSNFASFIISKPFLCSLQGKQTL